MKTKKRYQHFALGKGSQIINIHDVKDRKQLLHCPYCKREMIAKMGDIRDWHFAHKHNSDDCDYNHYLHSMAEYIICDKLSSSTKIPLIIKTKEKCEHYDSCPIKSEEYCSKDKFLPTIDIAHWIDKWSLENTFIKDGHEFRADIYGHNKNNEENPIFIEIYVTHQCEEEKINSGIKIIEFEINSEEDIMNVIHNSIKEGVKTRFYNFKPKEIKGSWNDFNLILKRFTLFKSGKAHLNEISCHQFNNRRGIFELTIPVLPEEEDIPVVVNGQFWSLVTALFPLGYMLANQRFSFARHCQICKWHAFVPMTLEHICKLYKRCHTQRYCEDNNPLTCPYFRVDYDLRQQLTELYNNLLEVHNIDLWVVESTMHFLPDRQ